jgi:hypothetical protein
MRTCHKDALADAKGLAKENDERGDDARLGTNVGFGRDEFGEVEVGLGVFGPATDRQLEHSQRDGPVRARGSLGQADSGNDEPRSGSAEHGVAEGGQEAS